MHPPLLRLEPKKDVRSCIWIVAAAAGILGLTTGCTTAPTPNADFVISKQLVGLWRVEPQGASQSWVKSGEYVFRADGTFTCDTHAVGRGLNARIIVRGKWRVENSHLVQEVTKSSHPHFLASGLRTRDRIVSLRNSLLVTRTIEGTEWRMRKRAP